MMVEDKDYQTHPVFSELEHYGSFYESLAHSVFGFVSVGTRALCNIDTYLFSSVQGTLASIRMVLLDGRINDAYTLLRKYHDSAVINIYTHLYLDANASIQNFIVQQIDDWMQGKASLPEYRVMSQHIRNVEKVKPITEILHSEDRYKDLRARCNDNAHYNFYHNVLLNDNQIALPGRRKALDQFAKDARDLFILHLSYMFYVNSHYMAGSDFVDCLECGTTPEPDSQYWVAPFVQEVFDNVLNKFRPDLVTEIKLHSSMQLL